MTAQNTPEWIKKLSLSQPVDAQETYPAVIDRDILQALEQLSLKELITLADKSGVREHQGVLTPPDEWDREQYIEILSDVGEMLDPQVDHIKKYLGI